MYDPERYENNKTAAARDAEQFVPMMIRDMSWSNKQVILDYGCGAGSTGNTFIVPQAEKFDSKIYAADISPDMIQHAKKAYPNPRVEFQVGDLLMDEENWPYKGIKFDKIFAVYVLHFVKNYRELMKRFFEILKPGGYFGFTVLSKSTLYMLHEKLGKSEKWSKYMKGYENYVPEWFEQKEDSEIAFKRNLTQLGYEIVQLEPHVQEYYFDNVNTVAELYLSLNPFVKIIPKDLHIQVKKEYTDFLREYWNIPQESDAMHTKYELLYGVVRKPSS